MPALVGLGEADPTPPFTDETPAGIMVVIRDYLSRVLLGRDPTSRAVLETEMEAMIHGNPLARGAASMALLDLTGKSLGAPAHALLGGKIHDRLPLFLGIGSGTPEEDAADIEDIINQGMNTVMIKMGALPIDRELTRMAEARRRFGKDFHIILDANQGWEPTRAAEFIRGLHGFYPELLEQPIRRWDLEGLRRLREMAPCPISADESLVTLEDAAALIREKAADVFSLKVSKNLGPAKTRQIAATAEAFGLKCLINSMLEYGVTQAAALQMACTLPNLVDMGQALGSVLRMADDVTDYHLNIENGWVHVPDGPGLGVNLVEARLEKYTRDYLKMEL